MNFNDSTLALQPKIHMKHSTYLLNTSHMACLVLPLLFLMKVNLDSVSAFLLSAALSVFISTTSAFYWAKIHMHRDTLKSSVSSDKTIGLRNAYSACFDGLWLIPKQPFLIVSDALWAISIKKHGQTVKAALIASSDSNHFLIGMLAPLGFYIGFSADFGIALTRIVNFTGGTETARAVLVILSGWVSVVFLFNGFFRFFLIRKI